MQKWMVRAANDRGPRFSRRHWLRGKWRKIGCGALTCKAASERLAAGSSHDLLLTAYKPGALTTHQVDLGVGGASGGRAGGRASSETPGTRTAPMCRAAAALGARARIYHSRRRRNLMWQLRQRSTRQMCIYLCSHSRLADTPPRPINIWGARSEIPNLFSPLCLSLWIFWPLLLLCSSCSLYALLRRTMILLTLRLAIKVEACGAQTWFILTFVLQVTLHQ